MLSDKFTTIDRELLRKHRKELGLSLYKVAKLIGINENTYNAWEYGYVKKANSDKYNEALKLLNIKNNVPLGKKYYLEVSNDEYEYEICRADTIEGLSKISGASVNCITMELYKRRKGIEFKKRKKSRKFVELYEDFDDE